MALGKSLSEHKTVSVVQLSDARWGNLCKYKQSDRLRIVQGGW